MLEVADYKKKDLGSNIKEEKERFIDHANTVYNALISKLHIDGFQKPLLISKNDSIERKVDVIIDSLSEKGSVLIISFPGAVAKTIAIAEIAKQKRSAKLNVKQFNHLSSQISLSGASKSSGAYSNKSNAQLSVDLGIRDPKAHTMPILSIFITADESITSIEDWTFQDA